jgi:hypothetical protein
VNIDYLKWNYAKESKNYAQKNKKRKFDQMNEAEAEKEAEDILMNFAKYI